MIKILFGNEPYLIEKQKKKAVNEISVPDFNLAEFYEWGEDIRYYLSSYPVMEDKKTAFLFLTDIKELEGKGGDSFAEYIKEPYDFSNLYIFIQKVDKRTSLFKSLQKAGFVEEINKIKDAKELQNLIISELNSLGGRITNYAYAEFLRREAYLDLDEVNLFNIFGDLKSLVSYDASITLENVKLLVNDRIVSNVFGVAKMIMENNSNELKRQAEVLSASAIESLSGLLWAYRVAYKSKYFSPGQIGVTYISLAKVEKEILISGMNILINSIDGLKNGSLSEKNAMWYTFQKLLALHNGKLA